MFETLVGNSIRQVATFKHVQAYVAKSEQNFQYIIEISFTMAHSAKCDRAAASNQLLLNQDEINSFY